MSDLFSIPKKGRKEGGRKGEGLGLPLLAIFKALFWEEAAAKKDISSGECVEAANCTTDRPKVWCLVANFTDVAQRHDSSIYRDRLKGWFVVARNFFLLLLNCSAWHCLAVA